MISTKLSPMTKKSEILELEKRVEAAKIAIKRKKTILKKYKQLLKEAKKST